jgi:hypothetical protein
MTGGAGQSYNYFILFIANIFYFILFKPKT